MRVKIRRAQPDDVVVLSQLLRLGAEEQKGTIWYSSVSINKAKQLYHVLTMIDKGFVALAQEEGGNIVAAIGMSIVTEAWGDEWMMNNEWVYVLPEWRETDVALQLMKMVEDFADANGDPETGKGLPIIIGMITGRDVDLKDELMKRKGYQYGGGNFIREPRDVVQEESNQDGATALAGGG